MRPLRSDQTTRNRSPQRKSLTFEQSAKHKVPSTKLIIYGCWPSAVAGFTTDVCVYATVTSAYDLGYHVYALRDAMAGYFPEQSEQMLKNTYPMWSKVLSNDDFLGMFGLERRTER